MKNTIITSILLFVLMLQIAGCKKEETNKKNNSVSEKKAISQTVTNTIFDNKNSYYAFVQKNNPELLDYELRFFWEKDLDGDGQNEAIISFESESGIGNNIIEDILILKKDNGIIKEIQSDFDFENYSYKGVQLISLRGKNKSCIKVETFEGPYAFGFAIYEMIDNRIKQIFISPSVGQNYREYDDSLVDSKKDGLFDTYIQNILYQNLTVKNTFSFENGISKLKKTDYIFEGYPEEVESLIKHYMCIRSINSSNKKLSERLQELCLDKNANETFLNKELWTLFYDDSVSDISPIQIDINGDEATAVTNLDFSYLKQNIDQLQFKLHRSNNKWQITKIEVVK